VSLQVAARPRAEAATLFVASRPVLVLDYFRTPYEVATDLTEHGLAELRSTSGGPALLWPAAPPGAPVAAELDVRGDGRRIPVFARVVPDDAIRRLLDGRGEGWSVVGTVDDLDGRVLASVWQAADGSVALPFDPDEVVTSFWSERYTGGAGAHGLKRMAMLAYYRVRPLLPRRLQIALRRAFARIQARTRFPRWPVETALHDLYDTIFAVLARIAGGAVPRIAAWPDDYSWALVLTHDVELADGYEAIAPVLALERTHGYRSSWNFVPRRYEIVDARLTELSDAGFEVGVHGLYHDGRDLESLDVVRERLPAIRAAAERWGAVGFRSPATHRHWDWMPLLGFDYDTSSPDTDPFEPQAGGCCTWLPFLNRDMVELPLTLPQDHTLFVILRGDEAGWIDKATFLRGRGGLALMDTHPDYLVDDRLLRAYGRFLERFADDPTAWKALPRDVAAWWRRRAESRLERVDGTWQIAGPAAGEARIEFTEGRW
jgi:hypothetical protein